MKTDTPSEGNSTFSWRALRSNPVPDDVARLLDSIPEWFGQPDSNASYVDDARTKETWVVNNDDGEVVGVVLLTKHFPQTWEIHLMAVERSYHGQGVGTALITAIEEEARKHNVRLLEVKTLGASHPDVYYARTRHFYERSGFLPIEETDLWGEDNPCLIMVKPLP